MRRLGLIGLSVASSHVFCTPQFKELNHPGKDLLLSKIRDAKTEQVAFCEASNRLLRLLLEEALGHEPTTTTTRTTPTGSLYPHKALEYEGKYCIVVILRSGASMLPEALHIMPNAKVGFVLIQRDEESADRHSVLYYSKFPRDIAECRVILIDPMLASGGSSVTAIEELRKAGVAESQIVFLNLVSCPEGIQKLNSVYPEVSLLTAQVDVGLNDTKYIVPGIGDFGDRYYGTG
jgi:uracil phosphoribosyltransferase